MCEPRENESAEPVVHITSDRPVTVELIWDGGKQQKTVKILNGNAV